MGYGANLGDDGSNTQGIIHHPLVRPNAIRFVKNK